MANVDMAMAAVPRRYFVPEEVASLADRDAPVPIGFGQTNSQPTTVRLMLEWLEVEPGNKILDVGSGSGWTTALLAYLTGNKGKVYAVERIAELVSMGKENAGKLNVANAKFYKAGRQLGLPKQAPFDRILVSAQADRLPKALLGQLKIGGKMVIPVKNDILVIEKLSNGQTEVLVHPGFVFVPLVENGDCN